MDRGTGNRDLTENSIKHNTINQLMVSSRKRISKIAAGNYPVANNPRCDNCPKEVYFLNQESTIIIGNQHNNPP